VNSSFGAFKDEMVSRLSILTCGASAGGHVVTPSGIVLDGAIDTIKAPPVASEGSDGDGDGVTDEIPTIDRRFRRVLPAQLLSPPATYEATETTAQGLRLFQSLGCEQCHVQNLQINHDRRVADLATEYDTVRGVFTRCSQRPLRW